MKVEILTPENHPNTRNSLSRNTFHITLYYSKTWREIPANSMNPLDTPGGRGVPGTKQ
jgi:hypothetical protein